MAPADYQRVCVAGTLIHIVYKTNGSIRYDKPHDKNRNRNNMAYWR
jgi:hypothetical protein